MLKAKSLQKLPDLESYFVAISISFILFTGNGIILDFDSSEPNNNDKITKHAIDTLKNSIKMPIKHPPINQVDTASFVESIKTKFTDKNGQIEVRTGTGEGKSTLLSLSIPNGATWERQEKSDSVSGLETGTFAEALKSGQG